ncbi:hypothetical protein BDV96DRAFT_641848 [Lophiotrema nucula]|uniref:Uncharacterized protein n=1 Tax=Lophiotrema nucula TaxID=690887 RepID=A0A6A5ZK67_9PLEO|nr:hypothetical protein BDV96DRAFT_641848 [Lophiotrema nucula]
MSTLPKKLFGKRKSPDQEDEASTTSIAPEVLGNGASDRPMKRKKTNQDMSSANTPSFAAKHVLGAKDLPKKRTKIAKETSGGKKQHHVKTSGIEAPREVDYIAPTSSPGLAVEYANEPISLATLAASGAIDANLNADDNVTACSSPVKSKLGTPKTAATIAKDLPEKHSKATNKGDEGQVPYDTYQATLSAVRSSAPTPSKGASLALPDPGFSNVEPPKHDVKEVVKKLLTGKFQWPLRPVPTPPQDNGPCPINWNEPPYDLVDCAHPEWKEAYLWRRPWTTNPPTFVEIGGMYMEKHNKNGIPKDYEETVRKQFMKLNQLVFLETGRYYAGSTSGLKNFVPEADKAEKKKAAKKAQKEGQHDNVEDEETEEDKHIKTTWEKILEYDGEEFAFRSTATEKSDVNQPEPPKRYVPVDLVRRESALMQPLIDRGVYQLDLDYGVDIIDGFINCLWPFRQTVLPNILNRPIKHGGQRAWQVSRIVWTAGKTIQLYCLAKQLDTSDVCDMAATQLYHMYKEEIKYRYEVRTGARKFNDVPRGFASALDFEPEDVNKLWEFTDENDQMRALWLDIVRAKAFKGITKLDEEIEAYTAEVLQAVESEYEPHITLARLRERIATGYGDVLDVPEPHLVHDNAPMGERIGVARSYSPLCGLTMEEFCGRYHKHAEVNLPCHLKHPKPDIPDDNDLLSDRPENHVKMTINGITGFTIINHCPFSNDYFRQLPELETEWNWERIRSVNFYDDPGQGIMNRSGRPSYFANHEKDQMGRYPSHPGYNSPQWKPEVEKLTHRTPAAAGSESMVQVESPADDQVNTVTAKPMKPISLHAAVRSGHSCGSPEQVNGGLEVESQVPQGRIQSGGDLQQKEVDESDSDSNSDSGSEQVSEDENEEIQSPGVHISEAPIDSGYSSIPTPKAKTKGSGKGEARNGRDRVKTGRVHKKMKKQVDKGRPSMDPFTDREEIRIHCEPLLRKLKGTSKKDALVANHIQIGDQPWTRPDYDGEMDSDDHDEESPDDADGNEHQVYDDELL